MGLFDKIKKRFVNNKIIEATPELIGRGLISTASYHIDGLYRLRDQIDIDFQIDDGDEEYLIFEKLFNCYFSLYLYAPFMKEMTDSEASAFGSDVLIAAQKGLSEVSDYYRDHLIPDDFFEIVYEGLEFYYHDKMTDNELKDLQKTKKTLQGEEIDHKSNPIAYIALKLHHRICEILHVSHEDKFKSFIGIFLFNINTITEHYNNVIPQIKLVSK